MAPFSGIEWLQHRAGSLRIALTAMPVLVYLVAVGIVLYSWSLSNDLLSVPGAGALYSVSYLVAGCAVIYAWLATDRQLRRSEHSVAHPASAVAR
jgi:hypothetical protein